jgi:chromosomal replication initiator protein
MTNSTGKAAPPEGHAIWASAREIIRKEIGNYLFESWIAPLTLEHWSRDEVRLGAPKPYQRDWISSHYLARISRALKALAYEPQLISIVVSSRGSQIGANVPAREETPNPPATVSYLDTGPGLWNKFLYPTQSFDSFISGPASDFGYRAAKAFTEGSESEIPLLFVYGAFGVGKTHLLNATALECRKHSERILFLRAEDFMRHFLGALHRKDTLSFKEEMRTAEVLIVDDLQHICRSGATASEFLYTVNAFADLRRRVMIAADRPPSELEGLGADVKSRLSGGLVIELGKPDRATKLAILRARAAEYARARPHAVVPELALERIADVEEASPRDIIGVLTKLAT